MRAEGRTFSSSRAGTLEMDSSVLARGQDVYQFTRGAGYYTPSVLLFFFAQLPESYASSTILLVQTPRYRGAWTPYGDCGLDRPAQLPLVH